MAVEYVRANNPGPYTLTGTMTWIIDGTVVVDPGPELPEHVDAILERAPDLEAAFVTHRHADHVGALPILTERAGLAVYGPSIVLGVDHPVEDGGVYEAGDVRLRAIATPGHTGEHFCYITDGGELFTGDTVLGEGTTTIFPPDGDMRSYMRSLRKLIDLEPRRLYPGHGPAHDDPLPLLEYYLDHRREREEQIRSAMKKGAGTPAELREAIYHDLDPRLHHAAELQIRAHLEAIGEADRS